MRRKTVYNEYVIFGGVHIFIDYVCLRNLVRFINLDKKSIKHAGQSLKRKQILR